MQTSLKLLIHYWPQEVYSKITHGIAVTSCFLQIKPCRFAKANLWYLKPFWNRVVEFNLFFELTSQKENLKVPSKNFWKFCNFVLLSQEKDLDWYFMDIFEAEINGHVSLLYCAYCTHDLSTILDSDVTHSSGDCHYLILCISF